MNRKQLLILFIIGIGISSPVLATEQIPDLLIIGNDTICLKSFPLEKLELEKNPFNYGEFDFPHTGCWRGYKAIWEITDNKLCLIEVIKIDSTQTKLDILKYFKENENLNSEMEF